MNKLLVRLLLLSSFFASGLIYAKEEFPGRARYPEVSVIETKDLIKRLQDVVVIDVRSEYEFETLHVKGAINFPVSADSFVKDVQNIKTVTKKDLVFYCNGHTCMKSYKAARKAKLGKIDGVFAFDAGIFDWARANPKHTVLLGEDLNDPELLISKSKFTKHQLPPKDFVAKVEKGGNHLVVLDVRDRFQRAAVGLFPFKEKWVPLERRHELDDFIRSVKDQNKEVLIYDEVGKQVRWLQYRLEKAGVKKYYFMKGGAKAYIDAL